MYNRVWERAESTSAHRRLVNGSQRTRAGVAAAVAFVCGVALSLLTGALALSERGVSIPKWVGAGNGVGGGGGGGYCVRVSRASDYPIAAMAIGSPPRVVRLLVRMGQVVPSTSLHSALIVFAEELMRSETLRCNDDRNCTDVAFLTTHTDGSQELASIGFTYGNTWSGDWTIETSIGAEGTISLVDGYRYELTRTHFCWGRTADIAVVEEDGVHPLNLTTDGRLYFEPRTLEDSDPLADLPAVGCNVSCELFPKPASYERSWLALSSDFLFEASTPKLDDRRSVVEQGLGCAPPSNEREIYELDCGLDVYASCRHLPSIPFRRVSQHEVSISIDGNASVMSLRRRESLTRIVGVNTVQDAAFFASMRLLVLLIVSFVVFNRAERVSASAFSTLRSALEVAAGKEKQGRHTWFNALTDAAVGSLAIVSRLLVLWHQATVLVDDGSADVVVWESIAVGASSIHFLLRNLVLKIDLQKEAPLSKLGGSMSLADASVAALMSVVQTPMLGASARDFDAVARLFCGVLISLFVFHRLFFSVASCAILATTTASDGRFERSYSLLLWLSCVLWLLQTAAVSFSFARLFVVPQAFSLVRVTEGGPRATESAVLLAGIALSIPYINSVTHRLSKLTL
jgi:hypothetical protein